MATKVTDQTRSRPSRVAAVAILLTIAVILIAYAAIYLMDATYGHLFHDELHYAQQARDIAEGGFPRYNRDFAPKYPPLYGAVLAPVRAAAGRDGFAWWARMLNVVLAVSALLPAYRLARLTLPRGWAITAAALGLFGAFQIYARLLLSESLFTPLMLWCTYALTRTCRRPTALRALTAGLVIGVCALTKSLVIVMAPAVAIAVIWSLRAIGPALKTCAGIAAGAAVPVLAWRFRGAVFPSERDLQHVFSYWNEFKAAGLLDPGHYIYWTRIELAPWTTAIAAPVLALAIAGLLARIFDRRPANRSFAAFVLFSALGVTVFTGIWMAQIAFYKQMVHERYLVFLWPLLTIAFVDRLVRPAGGKRVIGIAVAIVALIILAVPETAFDPAKNLGYFADYPSSELGYQLFRLAGGASGMRLILLSSLLVLPLLLLRKRVVGVAVVLLLSAGFAVNATVAAYEQVRAADRHVLYMEQPVLDWLRKRWRPGDAFICHEPMGGVPYRLCLMLDVPFSPVRHTGETIGESVVDLDRKSGVYRFQGTRPRGRILFLTRDPKVAPGRELSSFRSYRLIELEGGKVPEGLAIQHKQPPS